MKRKMRKRTRGRIKRRKRKMWKRRRGQRKEKSYKEEERTEDNKFKRCE